jgi:hypothetical protein
MFRTKSICTNRTSLYPSQKLLERRRTRRPPTRIDQIGHIGDGRGVTLGRSSLESRADDRLYTNAEDTLDPDDLIFPRAATRTGAKFQANVMTWEEQQAAEERHRLGESESGPSRHIARTSFYLDQTHGSGTRSRCGRKESRPYDRCLEFPF